MQLSDPQSRFQGRELPTPMAPLAGQLEYHQLLPRTKQLLEQALQTGQAPWRGWEDAGRYASDASHIFADLGPGLVQAGQVV